MINLLHIGKNALLLSDRQLSNVAHNIANVNTPGYSRQRVIQTNAVNSFETLSSYGNGVEFVRIERMRDSHLDKSYRNVNSQLGYWKRMSEKMQELEKAIQEPGENGLSNALDKFWKDWENLANNPKNISHRTALTQTTVDLTEAFHKVDKGIRSVRDDVNREMRGMAGEINGISQQLAALNKKIQLAEQQGEEASDLRDKFDLLIDKLSEYGNVSVRKIDSNKSTVIYLGSDEIVMEDSYRKLTVMDNSTSCDQTANECTGKVDLVWDDSRTEINGLNAGKIKGMTDLRDKHLLEYKTKLDNLAKEIAEKVNSIHKRGYDLQDPPTNNRNFFDPESTNASNIKINDEILDNPNFIAASKDGEEGDKKIALEIVELRDDKNIEGMSFGNYYGSLVSKIGSDSFKSQNYNKMYTANLKQTDNFRESVKGVSLNEEAANLIKYQQHYQAAAKIIKMADTLMSAVINMV